MGVIRWLRYQLVKIIIQDAQVGGHCGLCGCWVCRMI